MKLLASMSVIGGFPSAFCNTQSAQKLRYMCWEGYNDSAVISPFEKRHNTQLDIEIVDDSPSSFSSLMTNKSSHVDVVSLDVPWIRLMEESGLCHFLRADAFQQECQNLYPQFHSRFVRQAADGKILGIPTRWGVIGPTINTAYSDEKVFQSYAPCFEDAYRGKIAVMDWGDWPVMPIALHAGINPYKTLDQHELDEIRKTVRALFKNSPVFISDPSLAQKALLDGSVRSVIGSGSFLALPLRKAGFLQIKTVIPEPINGLNQSIIWTEKTVVMQQSRHLGLSKQLLKHLLSTQSALQLSLSDYACNLSTNRLVEDLYSAEQRHMMQLDETKAAWNKSFFHALSPSHRALLSLWQEELFLSNIT